MNCAWPPSPLRRHDHPAGHRAGRRGAELLAPQVQAGVDAGRGAGAGQHAVVVDVEHLGDDPGQREPGGQLVGVPPVRGAGPAVEQAGLAEHERAGAQRHDPRAALVRRRAASRARTPGPGGRPALAGTAIRSASSARARSCSTVHRRSPPWVRTGRAAGRADGEVHHRRAPRRSGRIPQASCSTPSSKGATPSKARTATLLIMPPMVPQSWQKIDGECHSCHWWQDLYREHDYCHDHSCFAPHRPRRPRHGLRGSSLLVHLVRDRRLRPLARRTPPRSHHADAFDPHARLA